MKDQKPSVITRQATGVAAKSQLDGELADLLARVESATGGDRELDLSLGKGLGLIPQAAIWEPCELTVAADDDSLRGALERSFRQNAGWELPTYRADLDAYRADVRAFSQSRETDLALIQQWHDAHPFPGEGADWANAPPAGGVSHWTRSLDAALALVERVLPGSYVGLQQNRWHDDPARDRNWSCYLTVEDVDGEIEGASPSPTPALALLSAMLSALSHQPPRAPDEPGDRAREAGKSLPEGDA